MHSVTLRDWYLIAKPGIIYGNGIHFIAGFLLASAGGIDIVAGLLGLVGTSFLIASACVVNNYLDRDIDARMKRTEKRASVTGKIPLLHGVIYAALLLAAGIAILVLAAQWTVLMLGVIAYAIYTTLYTFSKRFTPLSTLIGSIPGAIPAMAGYVLAAGSIDFSAWLVFFLVVSWQMPHFYAISLFRKKEYADAKLPVLGVIVPERVVVSHMIAWASLYFFVILLMINSATLQPLLGLLFAFAAMYWLVSIVKGLNVQNYSVWARAVFRQSLLLTLVFLFVGVASTLLSLW